MMHGTCEHMLEREITHEASMLSRGGLSFTYAPGDRVVLVCPHGCEDIIINVVPNPPDMGYDSLEEEPAL